MSENEDKGLIDKIYDSAERFTTVVGHALGVDVNAPDPVNGPAGDMLGPSQTTTKIAGAATPAAPKALPAPVIERPFEIVEVLGRGGAPISWIVTNGREKAECGSRQVAEAVLLVLAKKGAKVSAPGGATS